MTPMNAERSILKLLEQLCEEEPSSFQWQHLRGGEQLSMLNSILASACCVTQATPTRSGARLATLHHSVAVEFCGNGVYRGYCQEVGFFGVDPEDLRVLRAGSGGAGRPDRPWPRDPAIDFS